MGVRALLVTLLLLAASPQEKSQPRLPVHVESLDYPTLSRAAHIVGDVTVAVYVDPDGRVTAPPTVLMGHPDLAKAAEENLEPGGFNLVRVQK
jgi:Gram-negative bacterial TonB protein C-terminal